MKKFTIGLNTTDINRLKDYLINLKKQNSAMVNELLYKSCEWIKKQANMYLDKSGLNAGFISELQKGWQPITRKLDGSYVLVNHGRAYAVEFGIGIKGQGTYYGEVPPNYEYNIKTRYKNQDGSWIFRIDDINTLDIKEENVIPRENTGEIFYEEGRTIRTMGQPAIMFCFNAIVDFKSQNIANKIWKEVKQRYIN